MRRDDLRAEGLLSSGHRLVITLAIFCSSHSFEVGVDEERFCEVLASDHIIRSSRDIPFSAFCVLRLRACEDRTKEVVCEPLFHPILLVSFAVPLTSFASLSPHFRQSDLLRRKNTSQMDTGHQGAANSATVQMGESAVTTLDYSPFPFLPSTFEEHVRMHPPVKDHSSREITKLGSVADVVDPSL
jgi:hypothetical protein